MNNIGSGCSSSSCAPWQTDGMAQSHTSSTGIKDAPPGGRQIPLSQKPLAFTDGLGSKTIAAVSSGITITDSNQTIDADSAWDEIENLLRKRTGIPSTHLAKARQCLNELPVTTFQYFEDLADAVITRLNTIQGTDYPLTDKTDDRKKNVSALWQLCKYLTTAFAAQSLLTMPLTASAARRAIDTFRYLADSGMPNVLSLPMPDMCTGDDNRADRSRLQPGQTVCLKDGSKNSQQNYFIDHTDARNSVVITTGYGYGDVKVFADNGAWPDDSYPPLSDAAGTYQCAILKNPTARLTMITIKGNYQDTSMVVDFDIDKCRVPRNMRNILRSRLSPPVLNDICAGQPRRKGRGELVDGQTICLPNGKKSNYFYIRGNKQLKQLTISTSHGSGDLSLHVGKTTPLDVARSSPISAQASNDECVVYKNVDSQITYVVVKGNKRDASLALDFNTDKCRPPLRPGFTEETNLRTNGYPYKTAHLLVYKLNFSDQVSRWDRLEQDLDQLCEFYDRQSYGQFKVSWEMVEVHLPESISRYNANNVESKFKNRCHRFVKDTGVNPRKPGGDNVVMIATPGIDFTRSTGGYSFMTLMEYSSSTGVAVIAHELGHAMGLRHAFAINGGGEVIPETQNDSWYKCRGNTTCEAERSNYLVDYGHRFDVMGGGDGATATPNDMNLLYKSFFGWLDLEKDVPLVTESGRYRIYAFDHGEKDNGAIGLRLKSGNGDYTYWLAYRTVNNGWEDLNTGIFINLEGYAEYESDPYYWKTTSYLLDMTPDSINYGWYDALDCMLAPGKSFTDPWGGFTITTNQTGGVKDTASAWIEVDVLKLGN